MTVSLTDRGTELVPPNGYGHVPPDSTVALLQDILNELQQASVRAQTPALGVFVLSPDSASTPNGRILYGAHRTRISELVLIVSGAVTFTIQVGSSAYLTLPVTFAGAYAVIRIPFPYVLERGTDLQILATAATWAGFLTGYTE